MLDKLSYVYIISISNDTESDFDAGMRWVDRALLTISEKLIASNNTEDEIL